LLKLKREFNAISPILEKLLNPKKNNMKFSYTIVLRILFLILLFMGLLSFKPIYLPPVTYIYGYNQSLIIAKVSNATNDQVAYSSFEISGQFTNSDKGNWSFESSGIVYDINSKTGNYCYRLMNTNPITKTGLPRGKYILSIWSRDDKGLKITGATTIKARHDPRKNLPENAFRWHEYIFEIEWNQQLKLAVWPDYSVNTIDELRLHPYDARMVTYTYDPLFGKTSETDPTNITTYYAYDEFGRLKFIKDHNGNIVKEYQYNYALPPLTVSVVGTNPSNEVRNDGRITITVSGGKAPYYYSLNGGNEVSFSTSPFTINNLAEGSQYTVKIRSDYAGSGIQTFNVTIDPNTSPLMSFNATGVNPDNAIPGDGRINITGLKGGNGVYFYSLNNQPEVSITSLPDFSIQSLQEGLSYNLTIRDNHPLSELRQSISISVSIPATMKNRFSVYNYTSSGVRVYYLDCKGVEQNVYLFEYKTIEFCGISVLSKKFPDNKVKISDLGKCGCSASN
jgi:YD repeat-containing protein